MGLFREVLVLSIVGLFFVSSAKGNPLLSKLTIEYQDNIPQQNLVYSDKNGIVNPSDLEDVYLDVPELIQKYGYPVEEHHVITEDGYNLTLHRIPYGRLSPKTAENKPVVFLQHGLLCSSASWIINPVEKSLGYILADAGYDVWMGNVRGNYYSRKHVSLDPDKNKDQFWSFSWDEMGHFDVPANLDYVTSYTGQEKVFYMGHSMGTTQFWVAMSSRPEYNDKIKAMFALAPVAFMENMLSPIKLIAPFSNQIEWLLRMFGLNEFLPTNDFMDFMGTAFCKDGDFFQEICSSVIFLMCGWNSAQLNRTQLPVIVGHTPAGASSRSLVHYAQSHNSHKFRRYDHGRNKNLEIYGTADPPDYEVTKITAPVAFYWGQNDWLAHQTDVYRLANQLPNLFKIKRIADDKWQHLDFLFAIDINELLHNDILATLKLFD